MPDIRPAARHLWAALTGYLPPGTGQSIVMGAGYAAIGAAAYDAAEGDPGIAALATGVLTIPVTGRWSIRSRLQVDAGVAVAELRWFARLRLNGATNLDQAVFVRPATAAANPLMEGGLGRTVNLAAGATVQLEVNPATGGAANWDVYGLLLEAVQEG